MESTSKSKAFAISGTKPIPYWLCGVNFKMRMGCWRRIIMLYHTDSVESTSKSPRVVKCHGAFYTILTLWSQLQNRLIMPQAQRQLYHTDSVESTSKCVAVVAVWAVFIPYWLCGVNFKMRSLTHSISTAYTILTLWSQLQNTSRRQYPALLVYHTDSVESTSKLSRSVYILPDCYTILTLWSQLQNMRLTWYAWCYTIPYWLCGVNFKIPNTSHSRCTHIYHTDSVESTSKSPSEMGTRSSCYTILTLWSQLQNELQKLDEQFVHIPYWLCGVNFKMEQHSLAQNIALYHTDSVESTSKWRTIRRGVCRGIPYWLCGVNFKIPPRTAKASLPLYHTDSVESTSK